MKTGPSEEAGNSRHNAGFRISARHPIIASIIFALVAPDDDAKLRVLNDLLSEVDTGYPEDRRLLDAMVRKRALVNTIVSVGKRRAIYDQLERLLPNDPYVLQHRSILERELHSPDRAVEYAQRAVHLDKNNAALLNTLGMALELKARLSNDVLLRQATLSEASRLFNDGVARSPEDPFGYIGKVLILKQELGREADKDQKARRQAEIISLLDEAYEATHESEIIAHELAVQKEQLGTIDEAIALVEGALTKATSNIRLRDLYIQLLIQKGQYKRALEVAQEGVKFDPTSWRLQRHIARLLSKSDHPAEAVKGHYQAAIRHHKGDIGLMVELGSYLFKNGLYSDARVVFSEAASLPYPATTREKRFRREWWTDENKGRKVFRGKIKAITGGSAIVLSIPENFEVYLLRTDTDLSKLRTGDIIEFTIGFNAYGTIANLVVREEDRGSRAA